MACVEARLEKPQQGTADARVDVQPWRQAIVIELRRKWRIARAFTLSK